MKWQDLRRSSNVEDRRGQRRAGLGGGKLPLGGGLGLIVMLILAFVLGGPELVLNLLSGAGGGLQDSTTYTDRPTGSAGSDSTQPDPGKDFISAVLGSTEDVWTALFRQGGASYRPPSIVLFTDAVQSGCGQASSATGPFYCPADRKLYLDLSFFDQLARMGGPGDFAQAYVVGHEVGHHVQTLLGTSDRVREAQSRNPSSANRIQVAMELQADCYAGVWAHHADRLRGRALLEPGDVEEGLAAAAAIGDDRLQRSAGRRVSPESFTHGSSADRQRWLEIGLQSGDPDACDTFKGR